MGRLSTARVAAAALVLSLGAVPLVAGSAAGEESLSELQARMDDLQGQLDATGARIEELRTEQSNLTTEIGVIGGRIERKEKSRKQLLAAVVARADELYRSGGTDMMEVLFSSSDFGELTARAEILSQVSLDDASIFIALARSTAELNALSTDLAERIENLAATEDALADESNHFQGQFDAVATEYNELRRQLSLVAPAATPPSTYRVSGSITCPVAGPVSFSDTWGAPRVGHTHQGVDMMAAYGTPVVAIVSGTITYSGYGGSAGYWQILTGDDGNGYWYMHNAQNLVGGGHVSVGRQIATVGNSGNASGGAPHVHFEFHPGGGGPVNPTPLVASVC